MTNQEIKLRLVEAFIGNGKIKQGYNFDYFTTEVDRLVEYINKENLEDIFKYKECKSESISKKIDREKLNEEMLKIYNETMDCAIKIVENNNKINNKNTHN